MKEPMTTYTELMNQARDLMNQAESIRKQERAGVIADLRAKMAEHGITVEDLATAGSKQAANKSVKPPKYQGPNGELWAGGPGRKPEWAKAAIAAGELDKYLIA